MPVQQCRYIRTFRLASQVIQFVTMILQHVSFFAVLPEDGNPHQRLHLGVPDRHREVSKTTVIDPHHFTVFRPDGRPQLIRLEEPTLPLQVAIGLQIAHLPPEPSQCVLLSIDMVEDLGIGGVTVR